MTKDALDHYYEIVESLYDRSRQPLPAPPKGEFYSYSPAVSVIDRRGPQLWAKTGADTKAQEQLRETFRQIEFATELPSAVMTRIAEGHLDGQLADARMSDDPDADGLALHRRITEGNVELRDRLARTHGAKDAEELLGRAQRFVRSYPALAAILQQHGLGSRADIVEGIVGHVFSTGWR